MVNLELEIIFWIVLLTYLGVRLNLTRKGIRQPY